MNSIGLSPKTVAERLDVSRREANRMMARGTLPSFKVEGKRRMTEEALERFMKQVERKSNKAPGVKAASPSESQTRTLAFQANNSERIQERVQ